MRKNITQTHSKETFLFIISKTLERTSFYGLRSIILLYMIEGSLNFEQENAVLIYSLLTGAILFSKIIGAILGDLVLGNKKAIIIGGIIQSIGTFWFCLPNTTGLFTGLSLFIIGSSLYGPNVISNFGKLYFERSKLIDAGFSMLALGINIGAFFGVIIIGFFTEKYGWNFGFILSGIIIIISIVPIFFTTEKKITSNNDYKILNKNKIVKKMSFYFIFIGLFWAFFELSGIKTHSIQIHLSEISSLGIPKSIWTSSSILIIIPISIFFSIFWSYYFFSSVYKLMLGFLFGIVAFGILLFIPEIPEEKHTLFYLLSILFFGISETQISPIIESTLTRYSNPKYLAIIISLAFIPARFFILIIGFLGLEIYNNSSTIIGFIAIIILSLVLFISISINKMKKNEKTI